MTDAEFQAEIARLRALVLQVAERLAAASEVLSHVAERRPKTIKRSPPDPDCENGRDGNVRPKP
jgi:hypothetical protein